MISPNSTEGIWSKLE